MRPPFSSEGSRPARKLQTLLGALAAMGLFAACSHGATKKVTQQSLGDGMNDIGTEVQGDTMVRTYDLNHDHKADDWKTYKLVTDPQDPSKVTELLVKRELDTNFDGKPDVITWYADDGTKTKESFDLDYDGKIDVIETYEHGVLVKKETVRGGPGDQVAYYERGKKVRVERDSRGQGKIDTWEYYEAGKLQRIGEDIDGDGIVDRWTKVKSDDDQAPAASPSQQPSSAAAAPAGPTAAPAATKPTAAPKGAAGAKK